MAQLHALVPLDGSMFSRQILPSLRRLLPPASYALTLLRVASAPAGVTVPPRSMAVNNLILSTYESVEDATRARYPIYASQVAENVTATLERELQPDAHALQAAGFTVNTVVCFGDPAEAIVNYVNGQNVDLVAMATHGRSGVSRLVLGSVAEQVLRQVSVPVLVVRPDLHRSADDDARRN